MPTVYLFADSNLFLHYKPLHEIDWSLLGEFDDIEVVVCRTVQREIDDLKDAREGRRTDRARRAASAFLQIARQGPQEQRAASPRVVLSLDRTSLPLQDLADQLDYSQNDDRIIGLVARFKADNPSSDARLLTRDSGPILTAESLGIPCETIPDKWRLPPETDDRDRQIREMTQQLRDLQAQEPDFQFSCRQQSENRAGHVEIVYEAFQPLTDRERDELSEYLRTRYSPRVVHRNRISTQDITQYEDLDYPAWVAEYGKIMRLAHGIVQLEHCPQLEVTVQNTGSRPARNARVEIETSGNLRLTAPMIELTRVGLIPVMERPEPPPQPEPPPGLSAMLASLSRPVGLTLPDLHFPSGFEDQESFEYSAEVSLTTESSISLTCSLWRHSLEPKDFAVRLVPANFDRALTGEVICTVHAENLTTPARFRLVVTLSPASCSTLAHAREWFTTPHPNEQRK